MAASVPAAAADGCTPDYLVEAVHASIRIAPVAVLTPLSPAPRLSARLGHTVLFKREDLQPIFSFKIRGSYNKMAGLPVSTPVVCASAGNHAQGVALAAARLGMRATIVMPRATPAIKVDAVRARGGANVEVVLAGESFDEAAAAARVIEASLGATFVHPFDDTKVIAGQATIALEVLQQHGAAPLDAVFVCVGGGGLLAGVATVLKRLRPGVLVFGVEASDSDAMAQSLDAGKRVTLPSVGLFADGAAVKTVGAECFRLVQAHADGILRVDNDAICAAIKDVFEDTRAVLEPAGALGVAGAKAWLASLPSGTPPRTVVCVASGANVDFNRLRFVAERAEGGEAREAVFAATIDETPGAFRAFLARLGAARSVTEFNYRHAGGQNARAHVFVGVAVADRAEGAALAAQLGALDLTDDELAKTHLRYMVGGRAPRAAAGERVFRFSFPERAGALAAFLNGLAFTWNITLFHYRNHGGDFGRVLAGIVVPPADSAAFDTFLAALGYTHVEETANPAYELFLGATDEGE